MQEDKHHQQCQFDLKLELSKVTTQVTLCRSGKNSQKEKHQILQQLGKVIVAKVFHVGADDIIMGRSAPTLTASLLAKALTDALITVATFSVAIRFGSVFYKRFLSRENVRN